MIGADRASPSLGWAQQRGLCKDLDWILAHETLHIKQTCVYFFLFFFFFFYCSSFDIIYACISHSRHQPACIHCYCHQSFSFSHHIIPISIPFNLTLASLSNFYLYSNINSKLSLTLTSTCSIFTSAYSPALVLLLKI